MKLLQVLLLSGIRSGRPSSHGLLFATELGDEQSSEDIVKPKCFHQNVHQSADWRRQCITADECCSKRITKTIQNMSGRWKFVCGCIPAAQDSRGDAENCCSGRAKNGKCECLKPQEGPQNHLDRRYLKIETVDCCHDAGELLVPDESQAAVQGGLDGFNRDEMMSCGPRMCSPPGTSQKSPWWSFLFGAALEKKPCCGGQKANVEAKKGDKLCSCIPSEHKTYPKLETVDATMCCSKHYTAAGSTTCGCIAGGELLVTTTGAKKTDCCMKDITNDGYCMNDGCTPPKKKKTKGDVCCIDAKKKGKDLVSKATTGTNGWCGCVKGGEVLPKQFSEEWCCSGILDEHRKCAWLSFKEDFNPEVHDQDECFSGKADKDNKCLCMEPDSAKRGDLTAELKSECCSGALNPGGKRCSCILSGNRLRKGSAAKDCCTELAEGDTCKCGPVGFGTKKRKALGLKFKVDCCSHTEKDDFCACVEKGIDAKSKYCCAPKNGSNSCGCLKHGDAVSAGHKAKDVCCSGTSKTVTGECADTQKCT